MSSASEISPEILLLCHPHIVCMRFQPQKYFQLDSRATALLTRMHSSRMHTAHSLTISCHIPCTPPTTMHAPWQPCTPQTTMHAPPATTHPHNHAHPQQPCMPLRNHACLPATMHTPWQPHSPPGNHPCWQPCTHAPQQPHTPPRRQNHRCL